MNNERGLQRGKEFEEQIKKDFLKVPDLAVERLPDPTAGYMGYRNPCDFLVYKKPYMYYIECKTVHSTRLPFINITFNQRIGMLDASKVNGIVAGIICWFIPADKTYFIPIQVIERYRKEDKKSLNLNNMNPKADGWIEIQGKKKRVFFDYDLGKFIDYCTQNKLGEREYT